MDQSFLLLVRARAAISMQEIRSRIERTNQREKTAATQIEIDFGICGRDSLGGPEPAVYKTFRGRVVLSWAGKEILRGFPEEEIQVLPRDARWMRRPSVVRCDESSYGNFAALHNGTE